MKPKHKKHILSSKGKVTESPKEDPGAPPKKTILCSVALIIILGFAAYGNSINGQFVWDDEALIEKNEYIKDWAHIPQTFTKDIGAGYKEKEWNSYRPIQMVTYTIDHSLWKLNPRGYHLTNVLLHISVALSIYWLVHILFKENGLSLLTGIFFVVHPVHCEAVAYISGRADPLALLFMLLCFIFYIKSLSSKRADAYCLMLLSYALALFSKESSLILPLLLLLFHYSFKTKVKVKEFLSIVSLAFAYILLRTTVLSALLSRVSHSTTFMERLPGFFAALAAYIRLLFFPFNLHMEYGDGLFHPGNPKAVLGAALLIALLIFAFQRKKNEPLIFFSISWFFVGLLPVSNLYPINAYMAEHWLYLPSIGFFLMIAKAAHSLSKAKDLKLFTIIFVIGLTGFYSYLTIKQNIYWKDPISFYQRTLEHAPDGSRSYNNLGNLYQSMNKNEEAIAAYTKALETSPNDADIYFNLGNAYASLGKHEDAITSFKKAIRLKADNIEAYNNLGLVYQSINKNEEALAIYIKALEISPHEAIIYYNLGNTCMSLRKHIEAVNFYKKAIEIESNYADAHNNLAVAYFQTKQYKSAIESFDRAGELGATNSALLEALKPYR